MIAQGFGVFGFGGLAGILCLILWVLALVDCIKNRSLADNQRIIWVLVIIFVPCLGPILYYLVGRKSGG